MNRVVAVVTDRAHARFFDVRPTEVVELASLRSTAGRGDKFHSDREDSPGWGEHAYHGRRNEEARRHFVAVAARLAGFAREHPDAGVLLAGPGTAATALLRALAPPLAGRVVGTAKLNPREVTRAVAARTAKRLVRAHERAEQRALVTAVLEGLGTGRAENGAPAVRRALARGQVRALLVRVPASAASHAAAQEARRQGAIVTMVDDRDIAQPIEELAALLRWP